VNASREEGLAQRGSEGDMTTGEAAGRSQEPDREAVRGEPRGGAEESCSKTAKIKSLT